jgi:hypothetical protein
MSKAVVGHLNFLIDHSAKTVPRPLVRASHRARAIRSARPSRWGFFRGMREHFSASIAPTRITASRLTTHHHPAPAHHVLMHDHRCERVL